MGSSGSPLPAEADSDRLLHLPDRAEAIVDIEGNTATAPAAEGFREGDTDGPWRLAGQWVDLGRQDEVVLAEPINLVGPEGNFDLAVG